mgnify:CR=1 FL=1
MINIIKGLEIEAVKLQLKSADFQKNKLIEDLYKEYSIYLQQVRDVLFVSIEKGINGVCFNSSIKNVIPTSTELFKLFEKKISNLIYSKLPLITVEQLKIIGFDNDINEEMNLDVFRSFSESNHNQKHDFEFEEDFVCGEPIQFHINGNISNTFEYYETSNNENLLSIDFDNKENLNNHSYSHAIEKIGLENQFDTSILELIEEGDIVNSKNFEYLYKNKNNDSSLDHDLRSFDLIDKALNILLINLSYNINLELFNSKLIKKIISEDTFKYLSNKNFMIKHPYPFVINFDLNKNQSWRNGSKLPIICLLNLTTVELEFKNLNISIQRNKINELKNLFQVLIKKERYWRQKEINLNKIHR